MKPNMMKVEKTDFQKMDSFDQLQIFDDKFKEKLVYEIKYYDTKTNTNKIKYELTFIGIKQLILEMSQKGQSMEIIDSKVTRQPTDGNPINDVWYAEVKLRNRHTGHETLGVSEAPVFPWTTVPILDSEGKKQWIEVDGKKKLKTEYKQQYDSFGRTASTSKAVRNAERQQLPEMSIQLFVEKAISKDGAVQKVEDLQKDDPTNDPAISSNFCKDVSHKAQHDEKTNKCKECNKMLHMPQ